MALSTPGNFLHVPPPKKTAGSHLKKILSLPVIPPEVWCLIGIFWGSPRHTESHVVSVFGSQRFDDWKDDNLAALGARPSFFSGVNMLVFREGKQPTLP